MSTVSDYRLQTRLRPSLAAVYPKRDLIEVDLLAAPLISRQTGLCADALRCAIRTAGAVLVIPGRRTRAKPIRYDRTRYKERHFIENAFCTLKDLRRVATRYDKLAANFLSAVAIAALIAYWL